MAFTDSQKLGIVKIVGIPLTLLDAHLTSLGSTFVDRIEADVQLELERWDTYGGNFVKIHPTESNKGVETNAGDTKADIIRTIARLLELSELGYGAAGTAIGTLQIGR